MSTRPIPAPAVPSARSLEAGAVALVFMLCLSWSLNQVTVKLALPDIPPLTQATIRSVGGLAILLGWCTLRGVRLFGPDGTGRAGVLVGLMFGLEFVFVYLSLELTTASRMTVFLYTAPLFVALAGWLLLPEERFGPLQWMGLGLAFAGIALAFGVPDPHVTATMLMGDAMAVIAGALWGGTTVVIKATTLRYAAPEKTLAYQLAVSIPVLGLGALAMGERLTAWPGPVALGAMAYQTVWVVGVTFLLWFVLVRAYSAGRLSAFTFLTPLFGVIAAHIILGDPLSPVFAVSVVLVLSGLILINRMPARPASVEPERR